MSLHPPEDLVVYRWNPRKADDMHDVIRSKTSAEGTTYGSAFVIDDAVSAGSLQWIDSVRQGLELNSKRPTVDRRFYIDGPQSEMDSVKSYLPPVDKTRPLCSLLEMSIRDALQNLQEKLQREAEHEAQLLSISYDTIHVFRYQRFLEYTKEASKLDPHSDGTKVCDDTGLRSTHTMLLYLTDCETGGETLLMKECLTSIPANYRQLQSLSSGAGAIVFATQPLRGRILLFPHALPHAGAPVCSLPKICLRAEVTLLTKQQPDLVKVAKKTTLEENQADFHNTILQE